MADFESRKNFTPGFNGLISTTIIFGVIGGVALVGFETLRQLRRLPRLHFRSFRSDADAAAVARAVARRRKRKGRRKERENGRGGGGDGDGHDDAEGSESDGAPTHDGSDSLTRPFYKYGAGTTPEDWEMGHLYMARQFHASTPSPPLAKWPIMWAWQALGFKDWFYATHTGMDTVVYVRFLRAAVWWVFLHTFTTAPILLAIHLKFSKGVDLTDMSRASLSYLVMTPLPGCKDKSLTASQSDCPREPNQQGRKLLWIHLCIMYYLTLTWAYAVYWIGRGSVLIRRRLVERIREKNVLRQKRRANKRIEQAQRKASRGSDASPQPQQRQIDGLPAGHSPGEFGGLMHAAAQHSLFFKREKPWRRNQTEKRYGAAMSGEDLSSDSESSDDGAEVAYDNRAAAGADQTPAAEGDAAAGKTRILLPPGAADPLNAGTSETAPTVSLIAGAKPRDGRKKHRKLDPEAAGWRQRTIIVTNMPSTMRDEASVRRYFEEFLRPDADGDEEDDEYHPDQHKRARRSSEERMSQLLARQEEQRAAGERRADGTLEAKDAKDIGTLRPADIQGYSHLRREHDEYQDGEPWSEDGRVGSQHREKDSQETITAPPAIGPEPDLHKSYRHLQSPVQTVVLVRKMTELSSMLQRRQEVLQQLEAAHIRLAKNALEACAKCAAGNRKSDRQEAKRASKEAKRASKEAKRAGKELGQDAGEGPSAPAEDAQESDKAAEKDIEADAASMSEEEALQELTRLLADYLPNSRKRRPAKTIWEVLAEAPRELLDPHQPVTRLSALFRGQTVPTIDYLLTKLNLLTALVTEMRSRPPSSYEPTSTAFVTFRDPRQARMVWRELDSQLVIKVRMAPEVKDLDWERLMRTSFTGDLVRGAGVNTFFWAFTIFWVVIIQLITTPLFSIQNLETVFPPLRSFFQKNPSANAVVSITLPPLFVSVVTMTIPEMVFQISKRAQGFVAFSALYDQCLCRYWKFLICNVVIFFTVGVTAIETILQRIGNPDPGSTLDTIAYAFPVAAPFFVSYIILCMGTHSGLELLQAIIGLVQHLGARNAFTPRARAIKSLPRNFNRYYWLPFHTLILTICFIFTVLNPLVLPFALVYFWIAMIVFKKNFAYIYIRRFNEKDGVLYFVRLMRFSLDGLMTGQVVLAIFFGVTNQRVVYTVLTALLVPLTALIKIVGTRLWKSQVRALEDDEANALCGIDEELSWERLRRGVRRDYVDDESAAEDAYDSRTPLDARASGRFPAVLPPMTAASRSTIYRVWQKVHESFYANGNDRPSYIASHGTRTKDDAGRQRRTARFALSATGHAAGMAVEKTVGRNKVVEVIRAQKKLHQQNKEESAKELEDETHIATTSKEDIFQRALTGMHVQFREKTLKRQRSGLSEREPILRARSVEGEDDTTQTSIDPANDSGVGLLRSRSSKSQMAADRAHREPTIDETIERETERSVVEHEERGKHAGNEKYAPPEEDSGALVCAHPKLQWEDHPNNEARYNNPFYNAVLDPFLWLPRNPSQPLDLCDTIEWYGAALVSSQGGKGNVGEWDDSDSEVGSEMGEFGVLSPADIEGDETIVMSDSLAKRLEDVEEAEEVVDPAASLPKAKMEDYKRAIGRTASGTSETGSMRMSSLLRVTSNRSDASTSQAGKTISQPSSPIPQRVSSSPRHPRSHKQAEEPETPTKPKAGQPQAGSSPDRLAVPGSSRIGASDAADTSGSPSGTPERRAAGTTASRLAFVDNSPHKGHPSSRLHVTSHSRRATGASYMSHGTLVSAGGASSIGGHSISMRKALQAEVLEEERRATISRRLAAQEKRAKKKRDKQARKGQAQEHEDEAAHTDDEAQPSSDPAGSPTAGHSTIRQRNASPGGASTAPAASDTSSPQPGGVSQWGVTSLAHALTSWTHRAPAGSSAETQDGAEAAEMDELGPRRKDAHQGS